MRLVGPNFLSGVSMSRLYVGADEFTSHSVSELSVTLLLRILLSLALTSVVEEMEDLLALSFGSCFNFP